MISKAGGNQGGAVWRPDGKELFYIGADEVLMSVEVATVPTFTPLGPPKPLFKSPSGILFFDVSRDGQRFLFPVPASAAVSAPPYKVVLNWIDS